MAYDSLRLQIPAFVCANAPTLAPGGGAEVLPASLLADNPAWFAHNGFSPPPLDPQYPADDDDSSRAPPPPLQPCSAPFDFDSCLPPAPPAPLAPPAHLRPLSLQELSALLPPRRPPSFVQQPFFPSAGLAAPSPLGLPVYSASGFDLLSIMARVANRPHPRVVLGPVDMTCSFVVVDVRRYDHPIVYCSPSFCHLTGYSENEVLGRNCRFLQAPHGNVQRGQARLFTEPTAVAHLKKNLSADKECQTSIINYKKDGTAFMNLVTVIPIAGGVLGGPHEESDVVYHVGFQVDLTEQPNAILEKLRGGSYVVDYAVNCVSLPQQPVHIPLSLGQAKDKKSQVIPSLRISRDLKILLSDPAFVQSISISSSTTIPLPQTSSTVRPEASCTGNNQLLHLILLEALPDFIHVVSLKGNFLYVAPSVRRVLGYEPEEMVGQSISDYAHPEDVVPLMRELKEGSATGLTAVTTASTDVSGPHSVPPPDQTPAGMQITPRTVDLLFRARTKTGSYVWIECKGRLHVEPGKGRKAIVLSGRAKEMPSLKWQAIVWGGGLGLHTPSDGSQTTQTQVWGMMSNGQSSGGVVSFIVVGPAMVDVLGWSPSELIGREVVDFLADGVNRLLDVIQELCKADAGEHPRRVYCKMRHKNGTISIKGVIPAPIIYKLRSLESFESNFPAPLVHSMSSDVFDELDTSRDTSWQYELQQIRFANRRLEEEISSLKQRLEDTKGVELKMLQGLQQRPQLLEQRHEAQFDHFVPLNSSSAVRPPSHSEYARNYHSYLPPQEPEPAPHLGLKSNHYHHQGYGAGSFIPQEDMAVSTRSPMPFARDWDPSAFYRQNQIENHPRGLKRSWDVAHCR